MTDLAAVRAFIRSSASQRGNSDWGDRSALIVSALLLAPMLAGSLLGIGGQASTPISATDPAQAAGAMALVLGAIAALIAFAGAVGPIALSPADVHWLVRSPLNRRGVVARSAALVAAVASFIGAILGSESFNVLAGSGPAWYRVMSISAGACVCLAGVAVAILAQPSPTAAAIARRVAAGMGLLAILSAVVVAVWPALAERVMPASADAAIAALPFVTVAAVSAAAGGAVIVWRRLEQLPTRSLMESSARVGLSADATVALEPSFLLRTADDNYWRAKRLRSRPWPPLTGAAALAWHDWRILARRPLKTASIGAAVLLPALLAIATDGNNFVIATAVFVVALAGALAGTAGIRRDSDSHALRRLFAVNDRARDAARLVLPTVIASIATASALTVLVATGALPAAPWFLLGPASAPVLAVAAQRIAARRPVDHTSTPIVMPMTGAFVPSGWLTWAFTGLNVAIPGCAPLLSLLLGPSASITNSIITQVLFSAAVTALALRHKTR